MLTEKPNPYMTAFDMLYRIAAAYYTNNNAFCLIERSGGNITAFYPLSPSSTEFMQGTDGIYIKMRFSDGRENTFRYDDVIHLRRHYFDNEISGADNSPLYSLLDTADTLRQGINASVKNGTSIKGVLKFTSLVNAEQLKKEKAQFTADYFNPANSGGIAATDNRFEFIPTNSTAYTIPTEQIQAVNNEIYHYLGISPKIVSGEYSENDFSAFYESVIEPLAVAMSLEFSAKCKAEIKFTSERLEFSSAETRIKLIHEAAPFGILTINECRKLLQLPSIEGGDKTLQSLNYANTKIVDSYQGELK
jgi:HK97 family phage portal protein